MNEDASAGQSSGVRQESRRQNWSFAVGYLVILFFALVLVALAWRSNGNGFSIAIAALIFTVGAWIIHPIVGLNLTVFLTLVGDSMSAPWFPFAKNLSSKESLLFISRQLTITPLEITLVIGLCSVVIRAIALRETRVVFGPLTGPLVAFSAFVLFGLLHGIGAGGSARVAVYEVRGLVYLPIVYFLVSNVCRTALQFRRVLWFAMFGILGQSLFSLQYYSTLSRTAKDGLESLGEHGASIVANVLILFFIANCLFKGSSISRRLALGMMLVPTMWVYFIARRRAAIVSLAIGLIVLFAVLFWRQRHTFWKVVPVFTIVALGYVGAFWNSTSGEAFPAQAVKTVISPSSVNVRDKSSDLYRQIENYDLNYTIRQSPVTGLGFGQRFYRPVGLPDISFFEFYEYLPHNSILWIWIKMGIFGFISMLFLFSRALTLGAQKIRRMVSGQDVALVIVSTVFVAMYIVYAFVDIAWDPRNIVVVGFAFAVCANFPAEMVETAEPTSRSIPNSRVERRRFNEPAAPSAEARRATVGG